MQINWQHLTGLLGQAFNAIKPALVWISPLLSAAGVQLVRIMLDWWAARHVGEQPPLAAVAAAQGTFSDDFKFLIDKLYDQIERSDREAEQTHHELEQTRAALQVAHDEAHRVHEVVLNVMTHYDITLDDFDLLNSVGIDVLTAQRAAAQHLKSAQEHLDETKVAQQTIPQHLDQLQEAHGQDIRDVRGGSNGDAHIDGGVEADSDGAPA